MIIKISLCAVRCVTQLFNALPRAHRNFAVGCNSATTADLKIKTESPTQRPTLCLIYIADIPTTQLGLHFIPLSSGSLIGFKK